MNRTTFRLDLLPDHPAGSVISSFLVTSLAMSVGSTVVLGIALCVYVVGVLAFARLASEATGSPA